MKISYNWLKQYLDIDMPAEKVGQILTDIGLEVEGIEKKQSIEGGLQGLVVGHVLSAEKHPDADKLKLTTVDVGNGEPLPIVCGAPNVAQGQKVIVATVGTMLYPVEGEGFKIKKSKIRGQLSMGMICAEDEIGLGESHDGIMVVDENAAVGTPAAQVFDLKEDHIFEIGLTPNRSDATNHIGVAQDLLAALTVNYDYKGEITLPSVADFKIDNNNLPISVEVENAEACPRYSGITISGVKIQPSPAWLQDALKAIGVKCINNIVDITNFILHEIGQPLHAFDASAITGNKVVVKNLTEGSTFVTLDEVERKLSANDLMICNAEEGMCIAGVFGGIKSGVKDTTTDIFLESACFNAVSIRKTAGRYNLRTDAAMRFEKGSDPNITVYALKRAALLIKELAGGTISSDIVDVYPTKVEKPTVNIRFAQINRVAGHDIAAEKVTAILSAMGMNPQPVGGESLNVTVPTNKVDVLREIDVLEEVLRVFGFNNIPLKSNINASLAYKPAIDTNELYNSTANFLVANNFVEMMANSISNSKYHEGDETIVPLLNSLNNHLDILRKSMAISGLEAIKENQRHKNFNLRLFEFGKTYHKKEEGDFKEQSFLTLFINGAQTEESWKGAAEQSNFYQLKQLTIQLLNVLGINHFEPSQFNDEQFLFGLALSTHGSPNPFAKIGQLRKSLTKQFDVNGDVFYAEINWDSVIKQLKKKKVKFSELPKFPSTRRDLALVIDKNIEFGAIEKIATRTGKKLLKSVNLFDIFEDESKIGAGKKQYAVSFTFQDVNKTLTDKEIDKLMQKLISEFQKQLSANLR